MSMHNDTNVSSVASALQI